MEQFSKEAQRILSVGESIAFHYGHSLIGTEHLLLAFLKEKDQPLCKELLKMKIDFASVEKKVKDIYPRKDSDPLYMEYTIELKLLLSKASTLAKERKEDNVTPFVLSLALLEDDTCAAYEMLSRYKANIGELKDSMRVSLKRNNNLESINDLHLLSDIKKDPLIGREKELEQLINALSRRNKPNAILVGEPGVGKTAIVEELALRLKRDEVPSLKGKSIYELDLASLVGGTKYRGEFEEKIKKILKKVKDDGSSILFIDEIHNIVKAGGAEGAIDASNILKPYLSRGEIQIIGATTEDEFEAVFEKDKPLKRRFQVIRVSPSSLEETKEILKALKPLYEKYYHTNIEDEVLDEIVLLGEEYLHDQVFPDKAIDILDNTLVASSKPIDKQAVLKTLDTYYKIEIGKDVYEHIMNLIRQEIYGQDQALSVIEKSLKLLKYKTQDKDKPLLSMLFVGPTGVGKTKTAKIIGDNLHGNESCIYLNMAQYQDAYALNRLLSSSHGLYGEESSFFVKKLRQKANTVLLLDEIEKASNEILDFLLGILDKGGFYDSLGRYVDMHSSVIIMTTNYGYDEEQTFQSALIREKTNNEVIRKKLAARFRYEFLSRIDEIVMFSYLEKKARNDIAKVYLKSFENVNVEYAFIEPYVTSNEAEYQKYGARLIKKNVKKALEESLNKKVVN